MEEGFLPSLGKQEEKGKEQQKWAGGCVLSPPASCVPGMQASARWAAAQTTHFFVRPLSGAHAGWHLRQRDRTASRSAPRAAGQGGSKALTPTASPPPPHPEFAGAACGLQSRAPGGLRESRGGSSEWAGASSSNSFLGEDCGFLKEQESLSRSAGTWPEAGEGSSS